jgi:2-keto-4-pentenoate hydratase/2-oxohepta-3-ene-1,7-dioic acid hydratase in catechol pathway
MRLVRFSLARTGGEPRLGLLVDGGAIVDLACKWEARLGPFPRDAVTLLASDEPRGFCERLLAEVRGDRGEPRDSAGWIHPAGDVDLLPPLLPNSFRDFYAFEEHVVRARARRGLTVPEEWYRFPAFYFSNHSAIVGPGREISFPRTTRAPDFELEVGCVIGREGKDIDARNAGLHIAGYCVMNDWSARDIQREEMAIGLGPAKGKDFATSIGPALVTPDEIEPARSGKGYDLAMEARVNGRVLSRNSWSTIHYSFEEMIARASRDVWLYPGDLFGSGTVGGGSILELGPETTGGWLKAGDRVDLEIERLGVLSNYLIATTEV